LEQEGLSVSPAEPSLCPSTRPSTSFKARKTNTTDTDNDDERQTNFAPESFCRCRRKRGLGCVQTADSEPCTCFFPPFTCIWSIIVQGMGTTNRLSCSMDAKEAKIRSTKTFGVWPELRILVAPGEPPWKSFKSWKTS